MTWHADQTEGRISGDARDKLLADREKLVKQIEQLSMQPVGRSQAAALGRQEDLLALAKKVKAIDKKLGRTV